MTAWDSAARRYDWQLFLERRAIDVALEAAAIRPGRRVLAWAFVPVAAIARRVSGTMAGLRVLDPRPELIDGGF